MSLLDLPFPGISITTVEPLHVRNISGGITCGVYIHAALQSARKLGPGKRVVTVVIDSGLRYLNGDLYKNQWHITATGIIKKGRPQAAF